MSQDDALISVADLDHLRHMLGMKKNVPRKNWGFRNYFASSLGDVPSMERLVAAGLATRGRPYQDAHYYHATEKGCDIVGLSNAGKRRAFEP